LRAHDPVAERLAQSTRGAAGWDAPRRQAPASPRGDSELAHGGTRVARLQRERMLRAMAEVVSARELVRPTAPPAVRTPSAGARELLDGLGMRATQRTLQVLSVIAAHPGANSRRIGLAAGALNEGQLSKLLARWRGTA
jgi:hypothetical protein